MTESAAAYGGSGWTPRSSTLAEELGTVWASCGIRSEWEPLRAVLLHRPGTELDGLDDPDSHLMLAPVDADRLREQHDAMAEAYRAAGVEVRYVEPSEVPPPNQMFCADLALMTPSGIIVGRPASPVRAGEERWLARRVADLGIPILRSVGGRGTFEGADAAWLAPDRVLIGVGLRTNREGAEQVATTLEEQGVGSLVVDLPHGSMHLMGEVRIVDRDLAYVRKGRTPWSAVRALEELGYEVRFFPSEDEARHGMAHNFVVLGPRRILLPAGNPASEEDYRAAGIELVPVPMDEICKAAGAAGCLTGVLARESLD